MQGRTQVTEIAIDQIDAQLRKAYTANEKRNKKDLQKIAREIMMLAHRIAYINHE